MDDDAAAEYRPISALSVLALAVSVASPLALVGPLGWIVPLAAAGLAALAWRKIRASGGVLSGERIAVAALVLALFFLAWAVSGDLVRRTLLARQAERVSTYWLELLADGRWQQAHQLTLLPQRRVPPGLDLAAAYRESDPLQQQLRRFQQREAVAVFSARVLPRAPLHFSPLGSSEVDAASQRVVRRWLIRERSASEALAVRLKLTLRRVQDRQHRRSDWQVIDVELLETQ